MAIPKKVGTLPIAGRDEVKQTHEIGRVIPVLEALDISGKTITTDALLTQRTLADTSLNTTPTLSSPSKTTSRPCWRISA
ncbi:MAG: hypothetical protein WBM15_12320 [Chromatiaceae bacterium]